MGNCCGRESGNFSGEGRTLGSTPATAPPQNDAARAPKPKVPAGQKLGGNAQPTNEPISAKQAAAKAARERQEASTTGGGKLQEQLNKDKGRTVGQTLVQESHDRRAAREADANAQLHGYQ